MTDRGVSDAVGFVLVFALIVTSIGVVYATGISGLQDVRDYERVNNAERAFEVLADNVEDLTARGTPSRATEIELDDAQLRAGKPITVNVSGERFGRPNQNFSFERDLRPIVYDAGTGTRIIYVGGAIIREQRNGAVMVREPNLLVSKERTLVPLVWTQFMGTRSVGGSSTVLVRSERVSSQSRVLVARTEHAYNVTLNVSTNSAAHARTWRRFLKSKRSVHCLETDAATKVSCSTTGTERAYVTQTWISVTFE